jgi:tetratricopeptide (TPR) repeat protein
VEDLPQGQKSQPFIQAVKLTNRGEAKLRQGRLTEGLADLDAACRLAPSDPLVLASRASALLGIGNLEKALEDFEKALGGLRSRDLPAAETLLEIARIHCRCGDFGSARACVEEAAEDLVRMVHEAEEMGGFSLVSDFIFPSDLPGKLSVEIQELLCWLAFEGWVSTRADARLAAAQDALA